MIEMIVCDIDGTILPAGSEYVSENTIKAFRQLKKEGYQTLIASGRHYIQINPHVIEAIDPDYIVTINGACLVDRYGKTLEKYPLDEDTFHKLNSYCEEHGIGLGYKFEDKVVTYAADERFLTCYYDPISPYAGTPGTAVADLTRTHHLKVGLPLGIFLFCTKEESEQLQEAFPQLIIARSYIDSYDAFLADITKATTVESALRLSNLTWDEAMAFGDAGNDEQMIRQAGLGIAMGNGEEHIKSIADYVTTDCRDDGVVHALKHFHIL